MSVRDWRGAVFSQMITRAGRAGKQRPVRLRPNSRVALQARQRRSAIRKNSPMQFPWTSPAQLPPRQEYRHGRGSRPQVRHRRRCRAAAGEDHFIRPAVQAMRQGFARFFQGGLGLLAEGMHRRGIAKGLPKIGPFWSLMAQGSSSSDRKYGIMRRHQGQSWLTS